MKLTLIGQVGEFFAMVQRNNGDQFVWPGMLILAGLLLAAVVIISPVLIDVQNALQTHQIQLNGILQHLPASR
jgi:hypothetical protein